MKHSVHKSKEEARKVAAGLRKTYNSVIFSRQPEGWAVYHGKKKR